MPASSPERSAFARALEREADLAACRALLRQGSRSFFAASLLLPASVRDPACALYAFCRLADDAVDYCGDGGEVESVVAQLRERLTLVYAGFPASIPADRALADVVRDYGIPRALLDALIEGFEWDATARRYEDLSALHAYAARVAGAVGAMMALLMGVRDPDALARACDLGAAMQLTNIARDIGEDARAGRLYLPQSWLREAGIDAEAWLANPVFDAALASVVRRLLAAADDLYERVDAGIAGLPSDCRPGIEAARRLYAEIGRQVERNGLDSVSCRAVVPAARKLRLLLGAFRPRVKAAGPAPAALPEAGFLIAAVAAAPVRVSEINANPWWRFGLRTVWVIELFDRLERDERRRQLERLALPRVRA
ncbi:MAG: phytoene/squalene synthase family protein [Nevskia sp.]